MYGLVLEGGGAKGSYHIGAYKAILEEGIEIQGVAGTSIGALNGAMIVQGDFETCYKLWEELSYSMIIDEEDKEIQQLLQFEASLENFKLIAYKIFDIITGNGISIEPFRNLLDTYINEDRIRKAKMDFGIVTVSLTDLKPIEILLNDIPYGQLKDYLLASAYLPVFKIERLGGKIYLDGGLYNNLPFRILQNIGYKDMILVRTHGRGLTRKIDRDRINPIVISPSEDIGRSYTYESEIAKNNIRLGYYDGLKALRGLLGSKYYIDSKIPKDFVLNYFLSLTDGQINEIIGLMKLQVVSGKRALFEYIIPKLGSILGLKDDFTYEELFIALLEKKIEESNTNRFKIYSLEDMLGIVKSRGPSFTRKKAQEMNPIEKVIEKVDIALLFNKDDLISQVGDIIFCNLNIT